jgi:hypothetical protein
MKLAVVINISSPPGALALALKTQALLLEHMGSRLHSIRLAVPRLLDKACLAAIADRPDILVLAGGPRAARRAGQIAHERRVPIIFLPGARPPQWAGKLWGALSVEGLIEALAREEISPVRIGVGSAAGQIFFERASCGLLPQFAQLRESFAQAEGAAEWFAPTSRAANLMRHALRPRLRIACDCSLMCDVSTLMVTAQGFFAGASGPQSVAHLHSFSCEVWKHGRPLAFAGAIARAVIGTDWGCGAEAERFDCGQLCVGGSRATWAVLDNDPICFTGPIAFRFLPRAVETFAFGSRRGAATEDLAAGSSEMRADPARPRGGWNRTQPSHVASVEFRGNDKGRA